MINVKKIRPLFNLVVTTCDVYEKDEMENGVIVNQKGTVKEHQRVVNVGDCVKGINVGDLVHIDPIRYGKPKHDMNSLKSDDVIINYNIPIIKLNGIKHFKLTQADIDYVVEEYTDSTESSVISLKDSIL